MVTHEHAAGNSGAAEAPLRVGFLVSDLTFGFPAIARTIDLLKESPHFQPTSVVAVPQKHGSTPASGMPWWYLSRYGLEATAVLATYAFGAYLKRQIGRVKGAAASWPGLAREHNLAYSAYASPNDSACISFLRDQQIDVLLIMVAHILSEEVLRTPRLAVVNKHTALLPAHRGVLPYFWSCLDDGPLGVTFHLVTREIDKGDYLLQRELPAEWKQESMLQFYRSIFAGYPDDVLAALEAVRLGHTVPPRASIEETYRSYPSPADGRAFRARGFRVARWSDVLTQPAPTGASPPYGLELPGVQSGAS